MRAANFVLIFFAKTSLMRHAPTYFFSNDLPIEACKSMRNWSLGWNWGLACNCIIILTFFPLHDLPAYGQTDRLYRMADQGLAEHTFNKLIVLFILPVDF